MKNILSFAVAAMVAAASQAATISWSSGSLTDSKGNSPAAGGVTAYVFILDDAAAWEALTVDNVKLADAPYHADSKVSKGKASADIKDTEVTGTQAAPSYVAVFYKDNTTGGIIGYKTTAWVNALGGVSTAAVVDGGVFADAVTGGATYGNIYNAKTGEVEAVPEPTSLALFAIGIAAIGLRRKVAK